MRMIKRATKIRRKSMAVINVKFVTRKMLRAINYFNSINLQRFFISSFSFFYSLLPSSTTRTQQCGYDDGECGNYKGCQVKSGKMKMFTYRFFWVVKAINQTNWNQIIFYYHLAIPSHASACLGAVIVE